MKQNGYSRRRKWLGAISLGVILLLTVAVTLFVWNWLRSFSQESFREYLRSFGPLGWLVLLGLQLLQVFIALIPGELLETAAGYVFGPLPGTLICYAGIAGAPAAVFLLVRWYGIRLAELFISREKLRELRFLRSPEKREGLIFLLFFLPGTPKDLLTYFVGLTDMKLSRFLTLSLVARIPSVISSTFGGHLLGEGHYWGAVLLYGITGALSIGGLLLYRKVILPRKKHTS